MACDQCRKNKSRCSAIHYPNVICSNCKEKRDVCIQHGERYEPPLPRPPKKQRSARRSRANKNACS